MKLHSHGSWWALICVGWLAVLAPPIVRDALPASWWFQPQRPSVDDTVAGVCAPMSYDREINRFFRGEWKSTLQRKQPDGGYSAFWTYNGANDYHPDSHVPQNFTTAWWFEISEDACWWPAGTYRIHTVWTVRPDSGGEKVVRRTSEPFTIHPASQPIVAP